MSKLTELLEYLNTVGGSSPIQQPDRTVIRKEGRLGELVPREELLAEFLSDGGWESLDEASDVLRDNFADALDPLVGDNEELLDEMLLASSGGAGRGFTPLWDPMARERMLSVYRDGGIDGLNESYPEYGGLSVPEGGDEQMMIQSLLPPDQIAAMAAMNNIGYMNQLSQEDSPVPDAYTRMYRQQRDNGPSPFMRQGNNRNLDPARSKSINEAPTGANYISANRHPDMQRYTESPDMESAGFLSYMDLFDNFWRYYSSQQGPDSSVFDIPGKAQNAFSRAYDNQMRKNSYHAVGPMGVAAAPGLPFSERTKHFREMQDAYMGAKPVNDHQLSHNYGVPKETMEGPYGDAIATSGAVVANLYDLTPFGAGGEAAMEVGSEVAEQVAKNAGKIPFRQLVNQFGKEMASEGIGDAVVSGSIDAANKMGSTGTHRTRVAPRGTSESAEIANREKMKQYLPMPDRQSGWSGWWNNQFSAFEPHPNNIRDLIEKEKSAGVDVNERLKDPDYAKQMFGDAQQRYEEAEDLRQNGMRPYQQRGQKQGIN